jgi:hypothetical protein
MSWKRMIESSRLDCCHKRFVQLHIWTVSHDGVTRAYIEALACISVRPAFRHLFERIVSGSDYPRNTFVSIFPMGGLVTYRAIKSLYYQSRTLSNKIIFGHSTTLKEVFKLHGLSFFQLKRPHLNAVAHYCLGDNCDALEIPYSFEHRIHWKPGGCMSAN